MFTNCLHAVYLLTRMFVFVSCFAPQYSSYMTGTSRLDKTCQWLILRATTHAVVVQWTDHPVPNSRFVRQLSGIWGRTPTRNSTRGHKYNLYVSASCHVIYQTGRPCTPCCHLHVTSQSVLVALGVVTLRIRQISRVRFHCHAPKFSANKSCDVWTRMYEIELAVLIHPTIFGKWGEIRWNIPFTLSSLSVFAHLNRKFLSYIT